MRPLNIAFFGSSLVSSYWNGAATYYRGLLHALARRGHRITFYEPDAYERQAHRDIPDPDWARVVVYEAKTEQAVTAALREAAGADLVIKASGVGVFDELLEAAVLANRRARTLVAFWDVDAPATLERMLASPADPFRVLVPRYDCIFTYGGGAPVVAAYEAFGARACVPIYNALDPATHHPVPPEPRFEGTLGFMASRLPDREARVDEFFFKPAKLLSRERFLLGGIGWADRSIPENVHYSGHVYGSEHNAFNSSPRAILNVNRDSMARFGFSPPTRVFEAAGAAACVITDAWTGIELFLEPEREILIARDGDGVADQLARLSDARARAIGLAAQRRILADHTYRHRALEVEAVLEGALPRAHGGPEEGHAGQLSR
jgi:spore maturation protein CgeB